MSFLPSKDQLSSGLAQAQAKLKTLKIPTPMARNAAKVSNHDDSSASFAAGTGSLAAGKKSLAEIEAEKVDPDKIVKGEFTSSTLPLLSMIRGSTCSKCSERAYLKARKAGRHPPIRGLNSAWVTKDLLAMNRPSTRVMKEYKVIEQMTKQGVTAIINLCELGEHPYCGDGIEPTSGLSYVPGTFFQAGISVYSLGWADMAAPPFLKMLNVCHIIQSHIINGGKVAVHCHAGYGRTGIAIAAAMLMMGEHENPHKIVDFVRSKRPGCVQTWVQQRFVVEFAELISEIRRVYGDPNAAQTPYIYDFVSVRQRQMEIDFHRAASNPNVNEDLDSNPSELDEGQEPKDLDDSSSPRSNPPAASNVMSAPDEAPPSQLKPLQHYRSKIPFLKKSGEYVRREQAGRNRHITHISTPTSENPNSPRGREEADGKTKFSASANLKEAMARQNLLSHHDEKTSQDYLIPKAVSILCTALMRYSRVNPTAVSSSLVGVNTSAWPGRGFTQEWEDAFEMVYPSKKHDVEEQAATANMFSNMLASANTQLDETNDIALEDFDEEERRKRQENEKIDLDAEPVLSPPKWDVFDEELLENMKEQVNESDWSAFDDMASTVDEATFDIDARVPCQLLLDYFSQLSEPVVDLDNVTLVWAYNTDHRLDVDEDAPLPPRIPSNVNRKQKRSRWSVKEASFINELVKVERKSYFDNIKVVKKKGGKLNKLQTEISNPGMNPSLALVLFTCFVTCPHARATIQVLLRLLAKSKHATPPDVWKRACIRVGVALTQYDKKVAKSNLKGAGALMGRDLVEFGLEEFPDIVKLKTRRIDEEEAHVLATEDANGEGGEEGGVEGSSYLEQKEEERNILEARRVQLLDTNPFSLPSVQSVADYAVLLGRFVEALCTIYLKAGTALRVDLNPRQARIVNRIVKAKGYYDLQSMTWVAIEGYTGYWGGRGREGEDEKEDKEDKGEEENKLSSKSVMDTLNSAKEEYLDKPKFNIGTLLDINTLMFEDIDRIPKPESTSNEFAHQVTTDFNKDNVEKIQDNGGCEFLFKSYMVDVTITRQKEMDYNKEIYMRARYLKWLKDGKDEWISVGGGGKKKGEYLFGRVVVDLKNADKVFEVVERKKKKKKKKIKAAKIAEEAGLTVEVGFTPTPPAEEKKEAEAIAHSPLVARIQEKLD